MHYKLNEQGFYLGLKQENAFEDGFQTDVASVGNFVRGRFDFELDKWVEGATEEEIKEYRKMFVPFSVTKRQLLHASLIVLGIDEDIINAKIDLIPDELERKIMRNYFKNSGEYERYHEKTVEFLNGMGISEEQGDDLFILADTL